MNTLTFIKEVTGTLALHPTILENQRFSVSCEEEVYRIVRSYG